ncbi:FHA domain-containing protein [Nonomuraea sp. NPDC003727]
MALTCPQGHTSQDADYCDVCGARMAPADAAAPGAAGGSGPSGAGLSGAAVFPGAPGAVDAPRGTGGSGDPGGSGGAAGGSGAPAASGGTEPGPGDGGFGGQECPICRTPRTGRFCEVDGHDFESPLPDPVAPALWQVVVGADHAYFDEVIALNGPDAGAMVFPPYRPERVYPLTGTQVRIGRRSVTRGTRPEIDLGEPPADPGISHLHAVLMAQPGGTWALVDPGSANGTRVNGKPLQVNVAVPVAEGDRIHLGAWTVITLRGGTP